MAFSARADTLRLSRTFSRSASASPSSCLAAAIFSRIGCLSMRDPASSKCANGVELRGHGLPIEDRQTLAARSRRPRAPELTQRVGTGRAPFAHDLRTGFGTGAPLGTPVFGVHIVFSRRQAERQLFLVVPKSEHHAAPVAKLIGELQCVFVFVGHGYQAAYAVPSRSSERGWGL